MYLTIDKILEAADAPISAAEAHGIAAGMLCINSMITADTWLREVFGADVNLIEPDRLQLIGLFEQTQELLNSGDFEFELFLPGDGTPLPARLDALRHWCLGFLSGVGFTSTNSDWSGDSGEMLKDIVEFTRVDADVDGEEDEAALIELHEYIRVGVQVIREELVVTNIDSNNTLH